MLLELQLGKVLGMWSKSRGTGEDLLFEMLLLNTVSKDAYWRIQPPQAHAARTVWSGLAYFPNSHVLT